MKETRIVEIDYLRGIAMVGMILIHTSYYYLSNKTALFFWNYSQFAVQVFVFCSAFLFFQSTKEVQHISLKYFFSYLKKRFLRLLLPYYLFAIFYFVAVLLVDKLTLSFILNSLFLTAGIQINWLILLFLELTVFIPFLKHFFHMQKILFFAFFLISLGSAIFLLFSGVNISDRIVMWLPWLLIVFYTLFFVHYRSNKYFSVLTVVISAVGFFLGRFWLSFAHHSLSFYDNKYPPNIYYLLYGIFWIEILYLLAKKGIFRLRSVATFLNFLSRYSYSLFFIHYLFLFITTKLFAVSKINWLLFFFLILTGSIITQWGINVFLKCINVKAFLVRN